MTGPDTVKPNSENERNENTENEQRIENGRTAHKIHPC